MKVLVFDTETTGLPPFKTPTPDDIEKWPYIVQLSYLLFDTESNKITVQHDFILRVPVDIENSHIHAITNGISKNNGFDFKSIFDIFNICVEACDVIVGHNLSFDMNMIKAECLRHNLSFNPYKEYFCTMKRSIHVCNIINISGRIKYPKLSELHEKLFGYIPKNLHNSLIDVLVCFRCYYYLKYNQDICDTVTTIKNKF